MKTPPESRTAVILDRLPEPDLFWLRDLLGLCDQHYNSKSKAVLGLTVALHKNLGLTHEGRVLINKAWQASSKAALAGKEGGK